MKTKKWYASKTLWTNFAAIAALGVQAGVGKSVMDPALQAGILAVANAALRVFTSEPVR